MKATLNFSTKVFIYRVLTLILTIWNGDIPTFRTLNRSSGIAAALSQAGQISSGPVRIHWKNFEIEDAIKDIEELDVGDVNDDVAELPPDFPSSTERDMPVEIDMHDKGDWGQSPNVHFGHRLLIVNLRVDGDYEAYADPDFTGAILRKWAAMLKNADVDARIYSVESARAVINLTHTSHTGVVRRFLVQQPEVDYWEIDGEKYFPPGRSKPYSSEADRANKIKAMHAGEPLFTQHSLDSKREEF